MNKRKECYLSPGPFTLAVGWFQALLLERLGRRAMHWHCSNRFPSPIGRCALSTCHTRPPPYSDRRAPASLAAPCHADGGVLPPVAANRFRVAAVGMADGAALKPSRIAFAGTVTTDFLFPGLRDYLFANRLSPEIWDAPFSQYHR